MKRAEGGGHEKQEVGNGGPVINAYCRNHGWLFEDLKRRMGEFGAVVSEDPMPEADAWICIRTAEFGKSPDPTRTVVQLHDLRIQRRLGEAGCVSLVHPAQRACLMRYSGRVLMRPIGSRDVDNGPLPARATIGFFCREVEGKKGSRLFAEAVNLARQSVDFSVLMIGHGLEGIESLGQWERRAAAPRDYRRITALAVCSESPMVPLSAYEACAAGRLVLTSPREWPEGDGWAMVKTAADAEAFARLMVETVTDPRSFSPECPYRRDDWIRAQIAEARRFCGVGSSSDCDEPLAEKREGVCRGLNGGSRRKAAPLDGSPDAAESTGWKPMPRFGTRARELDLKRLLYEFDLNGFITVDEVLDQALIAELLTAWENRAPGAEAFDICFGWGDPWLRILSEGLERLDPVLNIVLGKGYRLDHAFCVTENFYSSPDKLHHQSHMPDAGIVYLIRKRRPFTTLLTVGLALREVSPMKGGFCCVPGSHKAEFDCPRDLFETMKNPHVRQIPQSAGSAVIFTEALTHGTYPAGHDQPRRSILLRLTPAGVQFRGNPDAVPVSRHPALFRRIDPVSINPEGLPDPYTRRLLTRPASFR